MKIFPPVSKVLVAEYPWLCRCAIGNGGSPPGRAVGFACIKPVETLASRNGAAEGHSVIRAGHAVRIAVCGIFVAPVGERHVIVDANGVDVGARPERIEMEEHVPRAVGRLVTEIFAPVRSIG